MSRIGIIDYDCGNLKSIQNALNFLNISSETVSKPQDLIEFSHLILPGVGAFPNAMESLMATGFDVALKEQAALGKPILGICLGMQLLCNSSDEFKKTSGLGLINAEVRKLVVEKGQKIPHMGWNEIKICKNDPIFTEVPDNSDVYFVHSYAVTCDNSSNVYAKTTYGQEFASVIGHKNVLGMQFHPEKSQVPGLNLLRAFIEHYA
jgi:glutamine amidotransferase